MRLKRCEMKASPTLAPENATELVRVIEAQRTELEDHAGPQTINNTLIINQADAELLAPGAKWDKIRALLE